LQSFDVLLAVREYNVFYLPVAVVYETHVAGAVARGGVWGGDVGGEGVGERAVFHGVYGEVLVFAGVDLFICDQLQTVLIRVRAMLTLFQHDVSAQFIQEE
jgi:hypothetical protein